MGREDDNARAARHQPQVSWDVPLGGGEHEGRARVHVPLQRADSEVRPGKDNQRIYLFGYLTCLQFQSQNMMERNVHMIRELPI